MEATMTSRERFKQLTHEELSAFERRELEFQRRDRQERATQLRMAWNADDSSDYRRGGGDALNAGYQEESNEK
jgi:hypothetical protein